MFLILVLALLTLFVNDSSKNTWHPDDSCFIDSSKKAHHFSDNYKWGQLPVGGGGYVTGIVIYPKEKNSIYIRTDVGGSYRWDVENHEWIQMLGWIDADHANLIGVDGMALDPNNPNRIYLALGKNLNMGGGIYRSDDRGKTWKLLMKTHYAGNGHVDRWTGECIAVDPNNSEIIYAGTREDGLWRSTDDGANWSKITDVPDGYIGNTPAGVRSIAFDPSVCLNGKSSIIYVGIPGVGIYYSNNGGRTFALLPGSPIHPSRIQVVKGELFVTHSKGVALWSDDHWEDITPVRGKNKNYVGLAVDRFNDNRIVVAQRYSSYYNPIYRSQDKGKTWQQINTTAVHARLHVSIPWWPPKRFSAATSCLALVPGSSGLYYTDWFGIWYTPDIWAATTDWYTIEKGHEETVVLTLLSPPEGALVYSGMADDFGFRHKSLTGYPTKELYHINEGFSIAVCEKYPRNIAILGAKSWSGKQTLLATSSDYGKTWTDRSLPAGSTLGRIAISSSDPSKMVYVTGEGGVYYTTNKGNTWQLSKGAPSNIIKETSIWNIEFVLAAGKVNNKFYLYSKGSFYVSGDGGKSWIIKNKTLLPCPTGYSHIKIATSPHNPGEVWISLDKKGLWKTSNGGKTFKRINYFSDAKLFSWGAPPPGSKTPTAYCYGYVDNRPGLYRSVDLGKTWVQINDEEHQFLGHVSAIAGDRKKFGQIYVGTGGNGIFYGKLRN